MPIYISNPPPDNHAVSMRNFQEASIEITAETSRNSTRSLPKHHLNITIDEFTSEKLEPIATSSPENRDTSTRVCDCCLMLREQLFKLYHQQFTFRWENDNVWFFLY